MSRRKEFNETGATVVHFPQLPAVVKLERRAWESGSTVCHRKCFSQHLPVVVNLASKGVEQLEQGSVSVAADSSSSVRNKVRPTTKRRIEVSEGVADIGEPSSRDKRQCTLRQTVGSGVS